MKFADFYKAPDAAPSSSANRNPAAQMTAHPNSDVNPLLAVDLTDLERLMNGQLKPLNQVVLGYTPVKDTEGVEAKQVVAKNIDGRMVLHFLVDDGSLVPAGKFGCHLNNIKPRPEYAFLFRGWSGKYERTAKFRAICKGFLLNSPVPVDWEELNPTIRGRILMMRMCEVVLSVHSKCIAIANGEHVQYMLPHRERDVTPSKTLSF